MKDEKYWRVRTRYSPTEVDFTRQAWDRNEVGIWYGAWTADDLTSALQQDDPKEALNRIHDEQGLSWQITDGTVHTARRFSQEIKENDWVVVCSPDTIHLGRIADAEVRSELNHPLNQVQSKEIWKFRKIDSDSKKSFNLLEIPDFYLLIPQAGQGNVFQFQGNNRLAIKMLRECGKASDIEGRFMNMTVEDRLDFLGPQAWESFCLGYLILTEDFLPTGVSTGGTLQSFDIVGHSRKARTRVVAQCKKDQSAQPIADSFIKFAEKAGNSVRSIYFAYGGCTNSHPNIVVISKGKMKTWVESEVGARYLDSFFMRSA